VSAVAYACRAVWDHIRAFAFPHERHPSWIKVELGPPPAPPLIDGPDDAAQGGAAQAAAPPPPPPRAWCTPEGAAALQAALQGSLDALRSSDAGRASEVARAPDEGLVAQPGGAGPDAAAGLAPGLPPQAQQGQTSGPELEEAVAMLWSEGSTDGLSESPLGAGPPGASSVTDSEASWRGAGDGLGGLRGYGGGADLSSIGRLVLRLDRVVSEDSLDGTSGGGRGRGGGFGGGRGVGAGVYGVEGEAVSGAGRAAALFEVLAEEPDEDEQVRL
jgi:hypothetical protein